MAVTVSVRVRGIKDGNAVTTDKRYVVYLVRAPLSEKKYDTWICGGALVSSLFIITSAACVDDVEYLYAIAGYRKYVTDENIETDECTKTKKKKVVYTCIPMKYELRYDRLEKWSFIDIALVKVESKYDFNDESYKNVCSYVPNSIPINYEARFQQPDTDGLVFGWGHTEQWRKPEDTSNYNQEILQYASIKIMEKDLCKVHYNNIPNMSEVIDQFMICTLEQGMFDEKGQMIVPDAPKLDGCSNQKLLSLDDVLYEEENSYVEDKTRREVLRSNHTSNDSMIEIKNGTRFNMTTRTRKSGICQTGYILIIQYDSRTICDSPPIQRGYDTVERYISWRHHPAGAAENEALANVKYVGDKDNNRTFTENSKAYKQFLKLKKFSKDQTFAVRPQRPLG